MRWPTALNALAVVGFAVLLAALSMSWDETRACPLFEECGPWQPHNGWEVGGWPAAAALVAVVLAQGLLQRRPAIRDAAMFVVALACAGSLAFIHEWEGFVVFGDVRFPLAGFWVAVAGVAVAAVASLASIAAGSARARGAGLPPDTT